jgi:hypothetical protein
MIEIGPETLGATKEEAEQMSVDLKKYFMDKGIAPNRAVSGAMRFVEHTIQLLAESGYFDQFNGDPNDECTCSKCVARRRAGIKAVPNDLH